MTTLRSTLALAGTCAVALLSATAASPTASSSPSLAVAPAIVGYGDRLVELTGTVASGMAGEEVTILSQPCRFTEPAVIGTVQSAAGGRFRFRVQPMLNTSYRARADWHTSEAVKVSVRPVVRLTRAGAGRYRVHVSTTNPVFLDGKQVVLQRSVGKTWATVTRARLAKASPETAITVVSAVTIAARVRGTLRAVLPGAQTTCYLGAMSNTVRA